MKFLLLTYLSCLAYLCHFAVAENVTTNNTSALPILIEHFMVKSSESTSNEVEDLANVALAILSQTTLDNETQINATKTDHMEKIELLPDIVFQLDNQLIRLSNNQSTKRLSMNDIVERQASDEGLTKFALGKMENQNRFVKQLRMQNRMLKRQVQHLNRQIHYILKGKKRASGFIKKQAAHISQLQYDLLETERKRINLLEYIQLKCQGNLKTDIKQENNEDEDNVNVFWLN